MLNQVDLFSGDEASVGPWAFKRDQSGRFFARVASAGSQPMTANFGKDEWLAVATFDNDWFLALSALSSNLYLGDRDASQLEIAGLVERARTSDFDGDYWSLVYFRPISSEQVLIETEVAVHKFDKAVGIIWTYVHEVYGTSVSSFTDDTIELASAYNRTVISMHSGKFVNDKPF